MVMKNNDVFYWSYNDKWLEKKDDGSNGGTTYWCCSRYAIYQDGVLRDTFWSGGSNRSFIMEDADEQLELTFLGNLDDYKKVGIEYQARYKDEDFLDLNHANSPRGNFYIRKDAKPDVEKMERIVKRSIEAVKRRISSELNAIRRYEKILEEGIDNTSHVPYDNEIPLTDYSHYDQDFKDEE